MLTVCNDSLCTGCMACVSSCAKNAITFKDDVRSLNCVIDENKCIECGRCHRICPNNSPVVKEPPRFIKQGWSSDKFRSVATSGGCASAIMYGFIKDGGYICSCLFENGEYVFKTTNDEKLIRKFAGSKYVKSDPQMAYKSIAKLLENNTKVLFIGLPCQCAGVLNFFGRKDCLYTIDLLCHGTPSKRILGKYLLESGYDVNKIYDIKFRNKGTYGMHGDPVLKRVQQIEDDSYLNMFLNSVFFTENCYSCKYASFDRISDITLGDAWGQLSENTPEGVSLVLCQSDKGEELIKLTDVELYDVDIEKAVSANHPLQKPANRHPKRKQFMDLVISKRSFGYAAFRINPNHIVKQRIKNLLTKAHFIPANSKTSYKMTIINK